MDRSTGELVMRTSGATAAVLAMMTTAIFAADGNSPIAPPAPAARPFHQWVVYSINPRLGQEAYLDFKSLVRHGGQRTVVAVVGFNETSESKAFSLSFLKSQSGTIILSSVSSMAYACVSTRYKKLPISRVGQGVFARGRPDVDAWVG